MQRCDCFILTIVGLLALGGGGDALAISETNWVAEGSSLWTETPIRFEKRKDLFRKDYLDVLFSPHQDVAWLIQQRAVFKGAGNEFEAVPLPEDFPNTSITACAVTFSGEVLLSAGNEVWRCRSSVGSEMVWDNSMPRLPKGFRCVDLFQDEAGAVWARSMDVVFRLDDNKEDNNPQQEWALIAGAPDCIETPGGVRSGMGTDSKGRFWVLGHRAAKAGFWIWDAGREWWKEIPSPESVGIVGERLPVIVKQSVSGVDPMVVCGAKIYRLTDWVWEEIGEGAWEKPWMASWSNLNQTLWVWDREGEGKLIHWSRDAENVAQESDWNLPGAEFSKTPTLLSAADQPGAFYLGGMNRLILGRRFANAIYDWSQTGLAIDTESIQKTGVGSWAALSESGNALLELRWTPNVFHGLGDLRMAQVIRGNTGDFRINDFFVWSGQYWLATSRGLMIRSGLAVEAAGEADPIGTGQQRQPPLPGQTPPLRHPPGMPEESVLVGNAISRIGVIPDVGIWALMEDRSWVWVWTQPDLESPGWVESRSPWRLDRPAFIQALNSNQALISSGNQLWITEAEYSFVAEDWSWNRAAAPVEFQHWKFSHALEPFEFGWLSSSSSGLVWMDPNNNVIRKQRWDSGTTAGFSSNDFDSIITGGTWDQPEGWIMNENTLHAFQDAAVLKIGRLLNNGLSQTRLIDAPDLAGRDTHVMLCNSTQWITWPVQPVSMRLKPNEAQSVVVERETNPINPNDSFQPAAASNGSGKQWKYWGGFLGGASLLGLGILLLRNRSRQRGGLLKAAREKSQVLASGKSVNPINEGTCPEKLNETSQHYWSVLGHELRTPLNAILGYAELLDEELQLTADSEQKKDVERIVQAARREITLIRATVDYSCGANAGRKAEEAFRITGAMLREAALRAIQNMSSVTFSKQCEIQLEPYPPQTKPGREPVLNKDTPPPELARTIEYFLEACLHADPGGKFRFEISENMKKKDATSRADSSHSGVFGIRLWGCQWPEERAGIKKWLAEMDPWKSMFTELENEKTSKDLRRQDLPLWKICLALSQTLARRMGGELDLCYSAGSGSGTEVKCIEIQLKFSPTVQQE